MADLVRAWDARLKHRPRRDPFPVVVLTDPGATGFAEQIVRARAEYLQGSGVPVALSAQQPSMAALLGALAAELGVDDRCHRFATCRATLAERPDHQESQSQVLDLLYESFSERHRLLKSFAEFVGTLPISWRKTAEFILQKPLLRRTYRMRLRRGRSFAWLLGPAGADHDLLPYVTRLRNTASQHVRDGILVEAFLRDLDAALRFSPYSTRRVRRRSPYVILLPSAVDATNERLFVELTAAALAPQPQGRPFRRFPVHVIAACGSQPPDRIAADIKEAVPATPDPLSRAAALINHPGSVAAGQPPVVLQIPTPNTTTQSAADDLQRLMPGRIHRNRWRDHLLPFFAWVTTLALLAGLVYGVWQVFPDNTTSEGPCTQVSTAGSGEEIGVSDGTCPFTDDAASGTISRQLHDLQQEIADNNRQIVGTSNADPNHHPYRTVIVFTPLTVPASIPGHIGPNLDEVQGVVLAQSMVMQEATNDPNVVPIRVLLANPGDRFAYGAKVAAQILSRARKDTTVAAVIGISQSRDESKQAIARLGDLQLPVISSTTTADQLVDSSPLFYQIAPQDVREAKVSVDFLAHQPVAVNADGGVAVARNAIVIEDPSDLYSQNLAQDFRTSFTSEPGNRVIRTFDYSPTDPGRHDPTLGGADTAEYSAEQLMKDVCSTAGSDPDLVYYSARAQQLPAVLDKFTREASCSTRQLAVMSGDETTRYVDNGTIDMGRYPGIHLYDAGFDDPDSTSTSAEQQFIQRFARHFGRRPGDTGAALAYDAFTAASMAIDLAYTQDGSIPPGVAATKLHDGLVSFTGVSGYIVFDGSHASTRVPPDKPVFVLEEAPGATRTLLACGRYAKNPDDTWLTWGPQRFPCPHDPPP